MLSCPRSLGANQRLYLTIAAGYKMTTEVLIAVAFPASPLPSAICLSKLNGSVIS